MEFQIGDQVIGDGAWCGRLTDAGLRLPPENVPSMRVSYTALSGLTPPVKGAVIEFNGVNLDGARVAGRLFRVINDPVLDDDGTFTIELEQAD